MVIVIAHVDRADLLCKVMAARLPLVHRETVL